MASMLLGSESVRHAPISTSPDEAISWVVHEGAAIRYTCADIAGPAIATQISPAKTLLDRLRGGWTLRQTRDLRVDFQTQLTAYIARAPNA
jgi:hypothetical protein